MDETEKIKITTKAGAMKIIKGTLIAAGGAGLAYLAGTLNLIDADAYTAIYVAIGASVINVLKVLYQKWASK